MADETKSSPTPSTDKVKEISLPTAVLALDATPDGKTIFAACQDGAVLRVDVESGKHELLGKHESYASSVALLPDGKTVISGGYDGTLQRHDLAALKTTRRVKAHDFWSWDMAVSRDGSIVASVTGRYETGGYKYEPAPEREPSVKVFDAKTGELRAQFPHIPPVQAVAISPDAQHVAAGNLMGEVRVWHIASGKQISQFKTDDLTSWGVIKSHHYLGGVFGATFSPSGDDLYVCGFGPMRDPMSGNGVQRWIRINWREGKELSRTLEGESGQGLMEAIGFHPSQKFFAMAGRLFQGKWNFALFETATGKNIYSADLKHRITDVAFTADGTRLLLAKAKGQEKKNKEGKWPDYGIIEVRSVKLA
jgi:WD40 repeat protein